VKIPRAWRCNYHGLPIEYGCIHCDRIADMLRRLARGPAASALRSAPLAAELVLMYRANDLGGSVTGTAEFKRARLQFARAARRFAELTRGADAR